MNPARYILTTSVKLSPDQSEELQLLLSPFILSTGDIFGRDRLNSLLTNHKEIERRHLKLWISSVGVLDSILNAETHLISKEEVERTFRAAKLYVRNKSFDEALTLLEKQRICIISGLPGIGKTTLARMLLLYFYRRKYDVVKIASDVSEAHKVGYHNKPRFYYYDDFLGQTAQADKLNKNEDQKLIDFMDSIRASKNSVFVLTTREYILNQAKLHYEKLARVNFDHRTCIIDPSKYSRRIRAQILYNHLHFSGLTREHVKSLTTKRGYLSIVDHKNYNPRLIEFLTDMDWVGDTAPKEYLALFLKKLDNPVDIWEHAFRNQLSDKAKNLLFILTTMPIETRINDVEKAFRAFHNLRCSKYSIAHSESDFQKALKELDGTFTATRRVPDCILVRFQNPSIRDFMQYLLLGGESLSDAITSLVFFEQAQWLAARLNEEASQLPMDALILHAASIIQALRKLIDAPSCTVLTYSPYLHVETSDSISRLATIASAAQKHMHREDSEWVEGQIAELSKRLAAGQIYPSTIIQSMKPLQEYGYLETSSGMELISKLKIKTMCEPSDLDEFETLANLIDIVPQHFKKRR